MRHVAELDCNKPLTPTPDKKRPTWSTDTTRQNIDAKVHRAPVGHWFERYAAPQTNSATAASKFKMFCENYAQGIE